MVKPDRMVWNYYLEKTRVILQVGFLIPYQGQNKKLPAEPQVNQELQMVIGIYQDMIKCTI
ncbi:hypothetical protein D3C87_2066150 [compost metagenome]